LFADLGFKNWYLRALLKSVGFKDHQDSSVALEDSEFFEQSKLHQTTLYFSASQAIHFTRATLDDFARQLRQAYDGIAKRKSPAERLPASAPKVFVSYTREDLDAVERLSEQLNKGGVAVWQDVQNLRVGDRWEQVLSHVIASQVDYFVVVQTKAMEARVESYVAREVRAAVSRNDSMMNDFRFLLPVSLGATVKFPGLESIQSIDIGNDLGIQSLISTIHEDFNRRPSQATRAVGNGR
jgi:hypothetical protein